MPTYDVTPQQNAVVITSTATLDDVKRIEELTVGASVQAYPHMPLILGYADFSSGPKLKVRRAGAWVEVG